MPCTSPRTGSQPPTGGRLQWSKKNYNSTHKTYQVPCGQCLECRLAYARQWAVRCMHETTMHSQNSFITLTYSDEKLVSPKLILKHFQDFMKRLRKGAPEISYFVTGEYGDEKKRPHWHAIIFGWTPPDATPLYTSDSGHQVFASKLLDELWTHGKTEFGSVTMESASYVARYAAKKLTHGHDGTHDYEPISKKSTRPAIGRRWLEKNYRDIFSYGKMIVGEKDIGAIPRYYTKWFEQTHPEEFLRYTETIKAEKISRASARTAEDEKLYWDTYNERRRFQPDGITIKPMSTQLTRNEVRKLITEKKFEELQNYLKL